MGNMCLYVSLANIFPAAQLTMATVITMHVCNDAGKTVANPGMYDLHQAAGLLYTPICPVWMCLGRYSTVYSLYTRISHAERIVLLKKIEFCYHFKHLSIDIRTHCQSGFLQWVSLVMIKVVCIGLKKKSFRSRWFFSPCGWKQDKERFINMDV